MNERAKNSFIEIDTHYEFDDLFSPGRDKIKNLIQIQQSSFKLAIFHSLKSLKFYHKKNEEKIFQFQNSFSIEEMMDEKQKSSSSSSIDFILMDWFHQWWWWWWFRAQYQIYPIIYLLCKITNRFIFNQLSIIDYHNKREKERKRFFLLKILNHKRRCWWWWSIDGWMNGLSSPTIFRLGKNVVVVDAKPTHTPQNYRLINRLIIISCSHKHNGFYKKKKICW